MERQRSSRRVSTPLLCMPCRDYPEGMGLQPRISSARGWHNVRVPLQ